jgi:hypothetical protein
MIPRSKRKLLLEPGERRAQKLGLSYIGMAWIFGIICGLTLGAYIK